MGSGTGPEPTVQKLMGSQKPMEPHANGVTAVAAGHCTLPYPKSRSARVLFPEKELIHLADTTSANLSQIQGRELHNVTVQKTLISIYTNAWQGALPKSLEVILD